jgi:1,4-dihydroxy-2-naphthoyl-CoA hydrolase
MSLFSHHRSVRFQDIDAAGIVFFAKFFEIFHDVYVDWLAHHSIDLAKAIASASWLAPLVHAEADYKNPLRFGDHTSVEISAVHAKERSLTVEYTIRDATSPNKIYATGKTAHAFVDRTTMRPCPIPDEIRSFLSFEPLQ